MLNDRGQQRRGRCAADVLAERYLSGSDSSVERGGDLRVIVVHLREPGVGARLIQGRLRRVTSRKRLIVIGLGRSLAGEQFSLAVERLLRLFQVSLGADLGGLGLLTLYGSGSMVKSSVPFFTSAPSW